MNGKLNTGLLGTLAVLSSTALLSSQEANAQQRQTGAAAVLEEVVVTARRREETLEDLPLSVVAISADAMQAQGIYNTEDISDFAANVTLTSSDRMGHSRIHMRGIGGGFPNPIQVFGSGMYIDNHYLAGSLGNYMSTLDIERVEVLRGPQGTLFGKNTTGGAVNIISAKPGPEFASDLTLRLGDFGQQDFRGMINVPFSDNVFGRFALASEQSDGYYTNRFTGGDVDFRDLTSIRAALRFTPGENWTIDTALALSEERNGQIGAQCRVHATQEQIDTQTALGFGPEIAALGITAFDDGVGQWGGGSGHVERLYPGATLDFWEACTLDNAAGDFVTSAEKAQYMNNDTTSVFVNAAWDSDGPVGALENLGIQINASWRDSDFPWMIDRDKSSLLIDTLGGTRSSPSTDVINIITRGVEVLFNGDVSERVSFTAGIHLYDEESRNGNGDCWAEFEKNFDGTSLPGDVLCDDVGLLFEFLPDRQTPGGPGGAFQNTNVFTESTAFFGHLTYALNEQWDLAVGLRYTEDDRSFQIVEFDASGTCTHTNPGDPPASELCTPIPIMNNTTLLDEGFFNSAADSFSEATPLISLTRNLEGGDTLDTGMVYFLLSEGFLTGSFNDELNLFRNPELAPLVSYLPEHVTNYEVGFKGTLADGRVRIAADVFFMDYEDKQESITIDNFDGRFGPDITIDLTQNAGKVDIYGIEFELRASPWDGGFLTLDFGYLENEYKEFITVNPDDPTGPLLDLSNRNIEDRTPDWTINASVGHTFQLASGATISPMLGVYTQGDYEWLEGSLVTDPDSYCFQDSYAKWRTRVTYTPAAGNWEASLFGNNITDERYLLVCEASRSGVFDYTYGRPDHWGLEFVARFGEN